MTFEGEPSSDQEFGSIESLSLELKIYVGVIALILFIPSYVLIYGISSKIIAKYQVSELNKGLW